MAENVKRYDMVPVPDCLPQMKERTKGEFVTFADYESLRQRCAELEDEKVRANGSALDWFERANGERIARESAERTLAEVRGLVVLIGVGRYPYVGGVWDELVAAVTGKGGERWNLS